MATPIEAHGALGASGDTTVESTAQNRWLRITCYNADTVAHTFTLKKGTTTIGQGQTGGTVAAKDRCEFGPIYVPSGTSVVVNNAEATTTTAPNYDVNGEY